MRIDATDRGADQPVGKVVGIRRAAVGQQVAICIPGEAALPVMRSQPIGSVVCIRRHQRRGDRLSLNCPIAHLIVSVGEGVGDRAGGGRAGQAIQQLEVWAIESSVD